MVAAIGLGVVLMVTVLGTLFTMVALGIRWDLRERFDRVGQKLEEEALTLIQQIFSRP